MINKGYFLQITDGNYGNKFCYRQYVTEELMNPEFWNIFGTFLEHGTKWGQKWDMRLFALISHDWCQK